jgi:prenylcysteine oxidase / farnesylcysteine lyase
MTSTLRLKWLAALLLVVQSTFPTANALHSGPQQQPIDIPASTESPGAASSLEPHRVAIIGAGAAGSSAAYHLRQYAVNRSIPLNITIFESSSLIGGRSTTINAISDPRYPAELGASIFAEVNHILANAAAEFGLTTVDPGADRPKESKYEIGIWDGKKFVYRSTNDDFGWMDMAKLLWRYGLAPLKTQRMMKSTVAKFLKMYTEPIFPWKSLTDVAMRVGLLDATASTGKQFLKENGIGEKFGREIIQASTRVNYGQNLGLIHGLETMVCMATAGAMAVEGGNWRIFEGMVKKSQAQVRLDTSVKQIVRHKEGGYELTVSEAEESRDGPRAKYSFDAAVIAAPFQYSGIEISPPLAQPPDEIPYVTLYVTLLTSPHRLSPKFFSGSSSHASDEDHASVPEMVITTLPLDVDLGASPQGVGPANFWSVSTLRTVEVNRSTQYLYKLFSPEPLTAAFLSELLDFPVTAELDASPDDRIETLSEDHISWSYQKKWHSYPYEYPRLTFAEISLDDKGLWYTSGIESFISTMETSALMGKNVAKLIVDGLFEERREAR